MTRPCTETPNTSRQSEIWITDGNLRWLVPGVLDDFNWDDQTPDNTLFTSQGRIIGARPGDESLGKGAWSMHDVGYVGDDDDDGTGDVTIFDVIERRGAWANAVNMGTCGFSGDNYFLQIEHRRRDTTTGEVDGQIFKMCQLKVPKHQDASAGNKHSIEFSYLERIPIP